MNTDFTLGNCLFGAVKITKNADPDKWIWWLWYWICIQNFHGQMVAGVKVIIFGADMNLSVHVDNKKKDILVLGEGPT